MKFPAVTCCDATFDRTLFERLAAAAPGHFWFEQRNCLLVWSIRRYFPRAASFCEVGCAAGISFPYSASLLVIATKPPI